MAKKVLVVATSRKTRGGITSVVKAHETGEQWKKYHCRWIETHRDGPAWRKILYFIIGSIEYFLLAPWYDIIHMHVSFLGSLSRKCLYMRYAKLLRKKTIVHFHPPGPEVLLNSRNQPKYRYLFENADKVIVLSGVWKTLIERNIYKTNPLNLVKKNNICVLYNPSPKVEEKRLLPVCKKEKYILFAGTLYYRKGYKSLVRAFSRIAKQYPDWKIFFAGFDQECEINELVNKLGLNEQVEILGWCDKNKMKELYRNAGVFCLASSGEGFPMVVLEAWAFGVPVVCTPVGGLPDIVKEGENALTFDFDNDAFLAKQLDKLLKDESLRIRLSCAGIELAKSVFDVQVINKKLEKIYETL